MIWAILLLICYVKPTTRTDPKVSERPPVKREDFIAAMRHVASSVTVVTTNGASGKHGATVSAFASVSADPPTVMVCLRSDSRIAKAVVQNKNFAACVLAKNTAEMAISELSTAVDHGINTVTVVMDNGCWGAEKAY